MVSPKDGTECEPHDHPPRPSDRQRPSAEALLRASNMFKALGDPERLKLIDRLAEGEKCVSELAAASGELLSTVSQRLRILHNEGLILRRRQGKHIYYALADEHVTGLIYNALEHANEGIEGL